MYFNFKKFKSRFSLIILILNLLVACSDSKTPDTTPPVISLNGNSIINLFLNVSYNELGASAIDDRDGRIGVVISGSVDINMLGSYTIAYSATDNAKNIQSITRTVFVVLPPDTTPPVITINGDSNITLLFNEPYNELGASAIDDRDGSIVVVISGTIDPNVLGNYTITYSATDNAENIHSITRTIVVVLPVNAIARQLS